MFRDPSGLRSRGEPGWEVEPPRESSAAASHDMEDGIANRSTDPAVFFLGEHIGELAFLRFLLRELACGLVTPIARPPTVGQRPDVEKGLNQLRLKWTSQRGAIHGGWGAHDPLT